VFRSPPPKKKKERRRRKKSQLINFLDPDKNLGILQTLLVTINTQNEA
jgi:hypothetical protein